MAYMNVDPNYPENQKTLRLIAALGNGADALPIRLWAWVARHDPQNGSLKDLSDQEIESCLRWWGKRGLAIVALVKLGFLEGPAGKRACHAWQEHEGHLDALSRCGRENAIKRWESMNGGQESGQFDATASDKRMRRNATASEKRMRGNAPSVPSVPSIPSGGEAAPATAPPTARGKQPEKSRLWLCAEAGDPKVSPASLPEYARLNFDVQKQLDDIYSSARHEWEEDARLKAWKARRAADEEHMRACIAEGNEPLVVPDNYGK